MYKGFRPNLQSRSRITHLPNEGRARSSEIGGGGESGGVDVGGDVRRSAPGSDSVNPGVDESGGDAGVGGVSQAVPRSAVRVDSVPGAVGVVGVVDVVIPAPGGGQGSREGYQVALLLGGLILGGGANGDGHDCQENDDLMANI